MLSQNGRRLFAAVAALSAWSCAEAIWLWSEMPHPGHSTVLAALWAAVLPLPLLLCRRLPTLAGAGVVALVLARAAAEYRGGAVVQSVILLAAFFLVEAERTRPGPPLRGAAVGGLLLGGIAAMDALDLGSYGSSIPLDYAQAAMLVAGGVGAGATLRDRREEAARLEAELHVTDADAESRMEALVAAERSRIAGEIDRSVALLLDRVRPLAERAARSSDPRVLRADMAVVERGAGEAMAEMRRALGLLRATHEPPTGDGLDLAEARAASRRTRLRQAAGWAAPVALLAAVGVFEQAVSPSGPFTIFLPGEEVFVPAPALGQASPWLTSVICVLPLLARARAPLAATAAVCALLLVRMDLNDLSALTFSHFYLAAAAAFFGAAHARSVPRAIAAGALGVGTSLLCMELEQYPYVFLGFFFAAMLPAVSAAAGLAVRDRVATAARARRAHEELDRRHEQEARDQVAAERLRAARELHDVVGHVVTVIGLQAAVAHRYAERDLEQAREAARIVAEVIEEAERDLGRLTAYLDVDATAAPRSVAEVVERLGRGGLPVTLEDRVGGEDLPLPIAQVAFRLVQEALTNVDRHAGSAATTVTIARRDSTLLVDVVNDLGDAPRSGRAAAGGGIAGMRERTVLYGGTFSAGPDGNGGWRVSAELPLQAGEVR